MHPQSLTVRRELSSRSGARIHGTFEKPTRRPELIAARLIRRGLSTAELRGLATALQTELSARCARSRPSGTDLEPYDPRN